MPRNVSSPLLEPGASARRTRRRSFIILTILGIIVLVGLLLIGGRPRLSKPTPFGQGAGSAGEQTSNGAMADYHAFLVNDDFKSKKLSTGQLQSLIGMYYVKEPKASELKPLFEAGTKVLPGVESYQVLRPFHIR